MIFLFVCSELIEELAGATDLKFGIRVEHVVSRNKTKDLSDISTNFWERWQNVLAYQIWGTFKPIDKDHLIQIINDSSTKTCDLDPIPTSL